MWRPIGQYGIATRGCHARAPDAKLRQPQPVTFQRVGGSALNYGGQRKPRSRSAAQAANRIGIHAREPLASFQDVRTCYPAHHLEGEPGLIMLQAQPRGQSRLLTQGVAVYPDPS